MRAQARSNISFEHTRGTPTNTSDRCFKIRFTPRRSQLKRREEHAHDPLLDELVAKLNRPFMIQILVRLRLGWPAPEEVVFVRAGQAGRGASVASSPAARRPSSVR